MADTTIRGLVQRLKTLMKHSNLLKPDAVIDYIYGLDATNNYKNTLFLAYYHYLKSRGLPAKLIRLQRDDEPITLPTPEQVDTLLSDAPLKLRVKLRLMAENGLRPIEVLKLTVKDVNFQNHTIAVRTAKRGKPRTLKMSEKMQYICKITDNLEESGRICRWLRRGLV